MCGFLFKNDTLRVLVLVSAFTRPYGLVLTVATCSLDGSCVTAHRALPVSHARPKATQSRRDARLQGQTASPAARELGSRRALPVSGQWARQRCVGGKVGSPTNTDAVGSATQLRRGINNKHIKIKKGRHKAHQQLPEGTAPELRGGWRLALLRAQLTSRSSQLES